MKDLYVQVGDGVEVDEAGRDKHAGGVDNPVGGRAGGIALGADKSDAVVLSDDYAVIDDVVTAFAPTDDPTALDGDA